MKNKSEKTGMVLVENKTTCRNYELRLKKEQVIDLVRHLIPKHAVSIMAVFVNGDRITELDDSGLDGGQVVIKWSTLEQERNQEDL